MFGQTANLPMDFNINEEHDPDEEVKKFNAADTPNKEDCAKNQADLLERIRSNIEKAQQMQKEQYNKAYCGWGFCFLFT